MRRLGLGLIAAAFAQLLALFLAGGGHGWDAPMLVSFALWILLPLTLELAWPTARSKRSLLAGLFVLTIAADAWFIKLSLDELSYIDSYVDVNGPLGLAIMGLWLSLWFFWQVLLLYSLVAVRTND